ncbi:MAG TPA: YkgJ family cysteine cluster protein [Rhodocyclaceae bacterium]|nr:YkgJ family cysteine cluster protein [Rhodocyclaceae bacterium]
MSRSCRPGCGACCIAPSISSPIPGADSGAISGQGAGKPAGIPCVQLDDQQRCRIFGDPRRPAVCSQLQASAEMCGENREAALRWLGELEKATAPDA